MTDVTVEPDEATKLRNKVVDQLKEDDTIVSPGVEAAMRKVPRHLAVPQASLDDAYSTYNAVVTQEDEHGNHISSVSAPQIQAMQLEQAGIRPGDNVLEIGTNGPNAAYLAELVGPAGQVTTVDIDPAPAERARQFLTESGYTSVNVVVADAENGLSKHAPYDAIVVTVGAWDIPPAWIDQLKSDGRLVVPLRINGLTRSYGFIRQDDHLVSTSAHVCGFVAVQGAGSHTQQAMQLPGEEAVTVLSQSPVEFFTDLKLYGSQTYEWLYLYLAYALPNGLSRMPGSRPGLRPNFNWGSMTALDGDTLAYLTKQEGEDEHGKFWHVGVIGHGPRAKELADQVVTEIHAWTERGANKVPEPSFRMAVGNARHQLTADPRCVIDKPNSRLVVDWPRRT